MNNIERKGVMDFLKEKIKGICTCCHENNFDLSPEVCMLPVLNDQSKGFPCHVLVCNNCGHIEKFSSVIIEESFKEVK